MRRGSTGRHETTAVGGERVEAIVPTPLPPSPPLDLASLQHNLEQALLAVGRLDALSTLLPDTRTFLYAYVRKEALLSSQIEGAQSSLSDLLLFELEEAPGVPLDHGLCRLREGFPLSNRLIREMHAKLLARGRGSDKAPGEFRRSQNWVGGRRPGAARFIPPPASAVAGCMSDLERFLHKPRPELPALVRAGLAHVQFETIHPFLDGNSRVGRLLITFLLHHDGLLRAPLLYVSLYFKQHRDEYYELLDLVRRIDWIVSSSVWRNRDRSRLRKGAGPPVISPAPRSSANRSRVETAWPMLLSVKGFPVWPMTRAPFSRQRLASGMSAVITMSSGCACSTIQSSAASNPSSTTSSLIDASSGARIQELETSVTSRW